MNRIVLSGRITHDIELRKTQSDISVAKFTIATQRNTKDSENNYKTDFIDCQAWRGTADIISKYFGKGSEIIVEGKLQKDSYADKEGNTKYFTYVLVDNFSFIGNKKVEDNENIGNENIGNENIGNENIGNENIIFEDISLTSEDLPF